MGEDLAVVRQDIGGRGEQAGHSQRVRQRRASAGELPGCQHPLAGQPHDEQACVQAVLLGRDHDPCSNIDSRYMSGLKLASTNLLMLFFTERFNLIIEKHLTLLLWSVCLHLKLIFVL